MDNKNFDALSHPLRIKLLRLLSKRDMSFSELKRELGISSSGKLDFHLKKLDGLVTINPDGYYTLTRDGFAALEAVSVVEKYGWQRRAYILNLILYLILNIYLYFVSFKIWYLLIFPISTGWILLYSYWSIFKRRVFRQM